jgi:hypothetical protein
MPDKAIRYSLFFVVSMALLSCEKKEDLWELPAPPANEKVQTFDLGPNYENVIFYQLATQKAQMANLFSWDLAFETGADEYHVRMNGGKDVQVYNTHDTDFAKTTFATTKIAWKWDGAGGEKDSTAVGDWKDSIDHSVSANKVYIFDLSKASAPRYKKVKFISVTAAQYTIRIANLDNSDAVEMTIPKDASRNYVHLNLSTKQVVIYEPPTNTWDIVFTRYRFVFYDTYPFTPYLLNGVLINTKHISIAETKILKYDDIDAEIAASLLLTRKEDEIGYDWKEYNLTAGKYTVNPNQIFIMKDDNGDVYKMRFIDFYNEQGLKGFPKFVYQKL